ncbi:MAG: ribose 5-phosphate isomerase B [Rhodospirillaceae bacterium]|nr:ribose 5-phosphate isomerase B [Rhodospirillaceae bacterium]
MSELRRSAPARGDTVAVAADHAGVALKAAIGKVLEGLGFRVLDLGTEGPASVDYPDFAAAAAETVAGGKAAWGVLVCGTGIGMSIAANRNPALRAALVHDSVSARLARQHNDANVLVMGARLLGEEVALDCVRVFFGTAFEGGRHERRVAKLGAR